MCMEQQLVKSILQAECLLLQLQLQLQRPIHLFLPRVQARQFGLEEESLVLVRATAVFVLLATSRLPSVSIAVSTDLTARKRLRSADGCDSWMPSFFSFVQI